MNKIHIILRVLIAFSLWSTSLIASATVEHTIGIARDSTSNNLRYIEHHQYLDNGDHMVSYYTPDMNLIAYKNLSYAGLPQHPSILQEDLNRGTKAQVKVAGGKIHMLRESADGVSKGALQADPNLIIDAGFDAYIKANWQTLIANGETRLQFAAAGYPRSITMRVQVEPTDNENTFAFKIYPSNFLIRLFIPALNLMYSDRQLVEYQGYSNLQPDDTESQYVTIQFAHHVTADQLDQPKALWIAKEGPVTQMISAQ